MIVLAGDIGGTHTRLARARVAGQGISLEQVARFDNAGHAGLLPILERFIATAGPFERCCLAVAGPTDGSRVTLTNLDWHIDARRIAAHFQFNQASLVNDFAAVGWGLNALAPEDTAPLQAGVVHPRAPRLALGAGTGLGVSICAWHHGQHGGWHVPLASEGGHIGFAPVDAQQNRLLAFLQGLYGRVSVERILSGPGVVALYRFCLHEAGLPEAGNALLAAPDPAQAIAGAGLGRSDPQAETALALFAAILGQTAGDLALVARAEGGIYLAGGIAPKLLPALQAPAFLNGFNAKGRFAEWTRQQRVSVILDPDIGLKGAALAASLAKGE